MSRPGVKPTLPADFAICQLTSALVAKYTTKITTKYTRLAIKGRKSAGINRFLVAAAMTVNSKASASDGNTMPLWNTKFAKIQIGWPGVVNFAVMRSRVLPE